MPNEIYAPVRVSGYANRKKTHCWRGHPFAGDNLLVLQDGKHRVCRQCQRIRATNYAASEHGKVERLKAAIKYRENNPEKIRARMVDRMKKARDYVDYVKSSPCADCDVSYEPCVMDLDHVRGTKKRGVSSMVDGGYTIPSLKEEIDKCELVCANCHRLRTHKRRINNGS